MFKNLQGSSHRLKAVGFRPNYVGGIFYEAPSHPLVGIFRAVFVGEGVLLVIDLGDEAVIIDLFRHGRCGRPGGAGLGNGFLAAGGQLGAESKAKERAQRPEKAAVMLHVWYLLIDHC